MMRNRHLWLHSWLRLGLLAASGLWGSLPAAPAAAQVREHRLDGEPREAPPPPPDEHHDHRDGYVWMSGRWDWRRAEQRWSWLPGRWEPVHPGKRWRPARWELRDDAFVLVDGSWTDIPRFPPLDEPPPPALPEDTRTDTNHVFLVGHWAWDSGEYIWRPGQRARAQPGMHYQSGEWVQRNGSWVWTNGAWVNDQGAPPPTPPSAPPAAYRPPPADPGPTSAPPPPRDEQIEPREGHVWARGHHEWRRDHYEWVAGHWEPQRARLTWYDGRWERRGTTWVYIDGGWR